MKVFFRLHNGEKTMVLDYSAPDDPGNAEVLERVVTSHRQTTSSRRPGKLIEGDVKRTLKPTRKLEPCPHCGATRWNDDEPHAPRWSADGTGKVDCIGQPVT